MSPGHSTPSGFYEGVRGGIPTLSPERRRILNSLSEQVGQRDTLNSEIPRYDDYTESVASLSSFADLANVALPAENHDTHADSTMPFTREPSKNLLNIIADLDRDGTQYQLADFNFKHDSLLAYRFDVNHPDTEAHSSSFTPTPATLDRLLSPQSDQDPEHIGQPIGPRKEWVVPPRTPRGRKPKTSVPSFKQKKTDINTLKVRARRSQPLAPQVKQLANEKRRKRLVCVICHFRKEACTYDPSAPEGPCLRCKSLVTPCVRYRVSDAALYREQTAPFYLFSQRWKSMEMIDITDWASSEIKTTRYSLTIVDAPYELKLRKFTPLPGDNLTATWSNNGTTVTYAIPPYGISNMEEAANSIGHMIERETATYLSAFLGGLDTDPLIWETYLAAFRRASTAPTLQEQTLLFDTLRLWVCCRNVSSEEHIVGDEKLGVRKDNEPSSPWYHKFPASFNVVTAQLECIYYTRFLRPLSKSILQSLMSLLAEKEKKYWFTVYLVLFMLLHSCSMLTRRDMESATAFQLPTEYCHPSSIKEHNAGTKTLLAHYHLALKGSWPFKLVKEGCLHNFTPLGMSKADIDFVTRSAQLAANSESKWNKIRADGAWHNDFYWISQLYDQDWKPEKMD